MNFINRWLCNFMERHNDRFREKMYKERKDWLFHTKIGTIQTRQSNADTLPEGEIILLVIRDQYGETHTPISVTHDKDCDTHGTVHYAKLGNYLGEEQWFLRNPRISEMMLEGSLYVHFQYRRWLTGEELTDWREASMERIR